MLESYLVLDLTDDRGQLAGALLAGLGADVVLVEPPGGSPSRSRGARAARGPSLSHWAFNRGKRSVVLDLVGSEDDREALRRLAAGADVLIESAPPGDMAKLGLGYDDLRAVNPALVYVSITPFGQTGPKAGLAATDLSVWAASMALAITGDSDRAPVRPAVPQAFLHAAGDAANGALLALLERARSGLGQHVDASAQASSLQATQSTVLCAPLRATVPTRLAGGVRLGPLEVQLVWPCREGFVAIAFLFGDAIGPFTRRLMECIHDEGLCDAETRDKDWIGYGFLLLTGAEAVEEYDRVKRVVGSFTMTKTKQELLDLALSRRLLIAPVSTLEDVATSPQLAARDYWDMVEDDELADEPVKAPGPPAQLSGTPLPRLGRPPRVGEHTGDVLAAAARSPFSLPADPVTTGDAPLAGLKVLDLMWVMAGPAVTRVLADFGATVVRVESATRVETARTITPFLDDIPEPERSGLFYNMNAGKQGLALNLSRPEARDVVYDLVRWADVVTESFSPKAMKAWGYDYETLRDVNPSIIMMSSCLMGQTGPLASYAGFGNLAAAIVGFTNIAGWPDRPPAGPFGAYTDYVSPRYGSATILAALDHRRRTGKSQYIDMSQAESAAHFLAPALLEFTVDGRLVERCGNADADMAPHGVYPCLGDDEWVALACATDEHRAALGDAIGRGDLADASIAQWTAGLTATEVTARCQAVGVPAHPVQSSAECAADPQLVHRGHFVEVDHDLFERVTVEGPRVALSRTPGRVRQGPPTIGQHTWQVLSEILGYDEDRIGDLYAMEILE